jgi:hypothetical protein
MRPNINKWLKMQKRVLNTQSVHIVAMSVGFCLEESDF